MLQIIKKYRTIIATIIITTLCPSCEKEIDVDLKSVPPHIVIEGIVKQDQLAKVKVSHTIDFNDNSGYPIIKDAVVKISDNTGASELLLLDETTGWYTAKNIKGVIGNTYKMSVTYEEIEYTASSKMPPLVKLDSLTMYKIPIMNYALPMIHFKDPAGNENRYYRCEVFVNGKSLPDTQELALSTEFVDGSNVHQFLPVRSYDDDNDPIKQGDDITIEFECIDKGTYTFFHSLGKINESLTNPTSNITGGALGYFMACTVDVMSIKAEWED